MKSRIIPIGLLLIVIVLSLACNSLTDFTTRADEAVDTVESRVTEAIELVTEGAPFLETAQALGTEIPELKDTAEAFITDNPEVIGTVQAFGTDIPELKDTAEAIITEGIDEGEAPDDIPVVDEATITNFYGSDALVSYTTSQDYQSVVDFYKSEMPANGWEADSSMTFELKQTATLTWNQVDQKAIVVITVNPLDNTVFVAITIQGR